jgi:Bacterial SH3 domain
MGRKLGVVTSDGLNVHTGPTSASTVIDQIQKNDQLEILESDQGAPGWLYVRVRRDGVHGYVSAKFVHVETIPDPKPIPRPVPPPDVPKCEPPAPPPPHHDLGGALGAALLAMVIAAALFILAIR